MRTRLFGVEVIWKITRIPPFLSFVVPSGTSHLARTIPPELARIALVGVHKEHDVLIPIRERRFPGIPSGAFPAVIASASIARSGAVMVHIGASTALVVHASAVIAILNLHHAIAELL